MQEKEKHINIIFKVITNEANDDEISSLNNWLSKDISKQKLFDSYKKTWQLSNNFTEQEVLDIDIEQEWTKIHEELNFTTQKIYTKEKKSKTKIISFKTIAIGIAAILIISLSLFFLFNTEQKTLIAENEILKTELPDGSQITLNKNSKLEYSKKFNKKTRNIKMSGEAYFVVEHNPAKPFIVETDNFYVEVVGTEFFISSNSKNCEVIVSSGTVKVYNNTNKSSPIILQSGEKANINITESVIKKEKNTNQNFLSWKTGKIVFTNHKLSEVILILEKLYNVEIEIQTQDIEDLDLNVSFDNQSIESVLNVIEATLEISIEKKGNKYIISK